MRFSDHNELYEHEEQKEAVDFMKPHGFYQYHTGGGCMALRKGDDKYDYILITQEDGISIPTLESPIIVGWFTRENEEGEYKNFANLDEFIDEYGESNFEIG